MKLRIPWWLYNLWKRRLSVQNEAGWRGLCPANAAPRGWLHLRAAGTSYPPFWDNHLVSIQCQSSIAFPLCRKKKKKYEENLLARRTISALIILSVEFVIYPARLGVWSELQVHILWWCWWFQFLPETDSTQWRPDSHSGTRLWEGFSPEGTQVHARIPLD